MTAACPACIAAPAAMEMARVPVSVQLSVPTIRCATCIAAIEAHLKDVRGVENARVNLTQKRVQIETDRPAADLIESLAEIGFEAFALDEKALGQATDTIGRDLLMRLGVAGFAMMNVMLLSVAVWSGADGATRDLFHLLSATIALPTVLYSAQPFFRNALSALNVGRLNMDVPISLAILLAGGMSLYEALNQGAHAYFDAALSLTFFLLVGRYLEYRTRAAARSAARELAALETHTVTRRQGSELQAIALEELAVNDTVFVATGVRVPVDGTLLSDHALTDRSLLTGESAPVSHRTNAVLNAGEINLGAPFDMRATAIGPDARLHQIARLVETAENARNRYTSLADSAARIYAPAVHLLALAAFVGWLLSGSDIRQALNVAIAVLIITCPCALGLAVPAVSAAAISQLYRLGFLVKSGTALERLAEARTVVLDKTGTLTRPGFSFDPDAFETETLCIAKALARASAHPLSRALDQYIGDVDPADLNYIEERKGQGVSAQFAQMPVALGRAKWLGAIGEGLVLKVGEREFSLGYEDRLVPGALAMTAGIAKNGIDLEILSGDTEAKTARLAGDLGIAEFTAQASPEDKVARVQALANNGRAPCMIGDGLNDTIALAAGHSSIAPGTALDAARMAADVVVVGNGFRDVPKLFAISRQAVRISRQNFAIALGYNAVAVPIALLGFATPLMAALAMSMSSITVLLNALRVGRQR